MALSTKDAIKSKAHDALGNIDGYTHSTWGKDTLVIHVDPDNFGVGVPGGPIQLRRNVEEIFARKDMQSLVKSYRIDMKQRPGLEPHTYAYN